MKEPASTSNNRRSATWAWVAAGVGFTLTSTGVYFWQEARRTEALRDNLPALVTAGELPAVFSSRLAAAHEATRRDPHAVEAWAELGRLYHANGYVAEALRCWRLLSTLQPEEARWPHYMADCFRTRSAYGEMVEAWHETLRRAPNYAPALLLLAEHQLKSGAREEAATLYRRRLELLPSDPYAQLGLARCSFQEGQARESQTLLAALVKTTPGFPSAHNLYAEVLASGGNEQAAAEQRRLGRAAGRFKEAEDPWMYELRTWCLDSRRLIAYGTVEYQNNEYARARKLFERAVELEPNSLRNLEVLGDLYLKIGEPALARATYERYLSVAGSSAVPPMLLVSLSESLLNLGDKQGAWQVLRDNESRSGVAPELANAKGVALTQLERFDEAVAAFQAALLLDPGHTEANFNLGALLLDANQEILGLTHVERALERQTRYGPALDLLGRYYLDKGRMEEAGRYFTLLWESQPNLPSAREALAFWNFQQGGRAERDRDVAGAERFYRAGIALRPDSSELNRALGLVLLVEGRTSEAVTFLEAHHRLALRDAQAKLFLSQAYLQLGRLAEAKGLLSEALTLAERSGQTSTANICREILRSL